MNELDLQHELYVTGVDEAVVNGTKDLGRVALSVPEIAEESEQPPNHETFAEFPTKNVALIGVNKKGRPVIARHNVSKRETECNRSGAVIEAEQEHVVTMVVDGKRGRGYLRLERGYFMDNVIDTWAAVTTVDAKEVAHHNLMKKQKQLEAEKKARDAKEAGRFVPAHLLVRRGTRKEDLKDLK